MSYVNHHFNGVKLIPGILFIGASAITAANSAIAAPTPAQLEALTQTCDSLPGVSKFKTDSSSSQPPAIEFCKLNGAVWFRGDMDIDCDGGSQQACKDDPFYLPDTSCTSTSGALDASFLPFIVLPQTSNGWRETDHNIRCGTLGVVLFNGRLQYGVFGDRGPRGIAGEASFAMAERLGIPSSPISGGVPSGVTYILFNGSNSALSRNDIDDEAIAKSRGEQLAQQLIADNSSDPTASVVLNQPKSGTSFKQGDRVLFQGTASDQIRQVRVIADNRWGLGTSAVQQGNWTLNYSFSGAGNRAISIQGLNAEGRVIASTQRLVQITMAGNSQSAIKSKILQTAIAEWDFFGRQTMKNGALTQRGRQEGDDGQWQRVVSYWQTGVDRFDVDTSAEVSSSGNPWSAAFISYVMKKSGLGNRFKYSPSHAVYTNEALKQRQLGNVNQQFVGYRITEKEPEVGDLICAPRSWAAEVVNGRTRVHFDNARTTGFYPSHCDIVVAVRRNEIDVLGGNVSQSVTKHTLKTVNGKLVSSPGRPWFAVLKNNL